MPAVWPQRYSASLLAIIAMIFLATLCLMLKVKLASGARKWGQQEREECDEDFLIGSGHKQDKKSKKRKANKAKAKTAVLVIQPCHVPSSSVSASSLLASSAAFEQSASSLACLVFALLFPLPAVWHNYKYHEKYATFNEDDEILPWCWLLALATSALVPVTHLLCDDVISGLGLDLFRSVGIWVDDLRGCLKSGAATIPRRRRRRRLDGGENEAFIGTAT